MITIEDLERAVLISTEDEFERQLLILSRITAVDLKSYRAVLTLVDEAAKSLPDVDWIRARLTKARDAAVDGYAYR